MAFAEILWMLVSYTCIFLISLLLAWTVYYDFTRTHIPAGMKEGGKLRAFNLIMNFSFGLGLFLEKLGVCSKIKFLRISFDGIPPMKDSKLLIKNMFFEHVPVRVYWPKTPSPAGNRRGLIYLHGGVGQIGSLRSYERVCRYLARESNSVVVNIGYRLSPEYRPPIQIQDCFTAIIYFLKNAKDYGVDPNSIVIGGDSSGATLAAGICQDLVSRTDLPRPRAQILLYPFLQALDFSLPSYQQNHSIPILFKKRAISLGLSYFYPKTDGVAGIMKNAHVPEKLRVKYKKWISADHVPDEFKVRGYVPAEPAPFSEELYQLCQPGFQSKYSPLIAEDEIIRQVPEAYILTCEYDVVRDDGLLYKKRLEDNGVRVTWHHLKDGFHGIAFVIDYGPLQFQGTQIAMENVIHFLHGLSK
ncbi:arylacetamide deacetylase-like 4 [Eublepharis macularius]|uniref:Arylacetamide deacetylase-like 4 n=1 Tax=Eublepharis macularius TaxID=481883 RepID=A0AA97LJC4_EUBMA|nr:arylacetamide deacetylase-like 4 [Eublepharis macularius]